MTMLVYIILILDYTVMILVVHQMHNYYDDDVTMCQAVPVTLHLMIVANGDNCNKYYATKL